MKNKYFIIKTYLENKEKYYYVKIKYYEEIDEIDIGGLKEKCFEASINKKLNYGFIKMIQNHKDCSLNKNFKHGDETINFLQNCIYFLFNYYSNLDFLKLIDNSFIYCKEGKLSLPDFYTIKYGHTWYESYLDILPEKKKLKDEIKIIKKLYKKKLNEKINLTKDDFLQEYYLFYLKKSKDIKLIYNLYEEDMTFKEYLTKIFNKNIDCYYFISLFNKIFGDKLHGKEWIIKKKSIEKYKINSVFQRIDKNIEHINLEKLKKNILKIEREEDIKKGGNLTGVIVFNKL